MTDRVLQLSSISKRFGELVANDNISLALNRGEVLALLGENGAGKSTLMSILFGHYVADSGAIEVYGKPLPPGNPKAALTAGVGMVHQHFALADNLSVLDNVLAGWDAPWSIRSSRNTVRKQLLRCAQDFGLEVNPDARIADLSVGERQRVEILKALARGVRILILDEPTAVLTPQESASLFKTLKAFVAQGLSIIFISHKLEEVLAVSHRIAVLRGGKLIGEVNTVEANAAMLAEMMVGHRVAMPERPREAGGTSSTVRPLVVEQVSVIEQGRHLLAGVRFEVMSGEIFGIAGVAGNGQQALASVLSGTQHLSGGRVLVDGHAMPANPRAWIDGGVARIPEDRVALGVVGDATLAENAMIEHHRSDQSLAKTRWLKWLGVLDRQAATRTAQEIVETFDVRHQSLQQPIRALSGGNIQKFILGRELSRAPKLIIANQPTWGLDIGAVAYVHQQLLAARQRGAAIVLISEEIEELFALADRIAVMFHGRLSEPRPAAQWSTQSLGLAMMGSSTEAKAA